MEGRYLSSKNALDRLLEEYKKYKSLYIAFDFDSTVFDYHNSGDTFNVVEDKLRRAKEQGHKLILFTSRKDADLEFAINYCSEHGYKPDFVNENPEVCPGCVKPYYNILLDDRAGLDSAYQTLCYLLNNIEFLQ